MPGRYECKLSAAALKKAVDELNEPEDNDLRLAAIDRLRTRFQEQFDDLELIRSDDAFLLRYLRVRKFDEDRALKTLENYHRHRKNWPELFDKIDNPEQMKDFLESCGTVPLPGRAKDGTFVIVTRGGFNYGEGHGAFEYCVSKILTCEKLCEDEEFQIYGLTIVDDMANFGMALSMQMALYARSAIGILQDSMPIRLKHAHILNEGAAFDAMYKVIELFLSEKNKKRLTLHGTETKGLQDSIDKDYLPFFLGGDGPDLNPQRWTQELLKTTGDGEETGL